MLNILVIIFTVFLSAVFFMFWLTGSKKIDPKPLSDTLGQTAGSFGDSLEDAKENLEQNSKDSFNNIKDTIYEKAQTSLDTVFEKEKDKKETVSVNVVSISVAEKKTGNLYSIDLSKETNLRVTMVKGNIYYFKFENIPPDYCLYIKDQKIELLSGKIIELQFSSSGSFPIKTDTCNLTQRSIGEIIVE